MDVPIEGTTIPLSQNRALMQLPTPTSSSLIQTYQYLPLKHDRDIRLLYLLPGSDKAPLSCSLRIVSLSELPVYEAISYTWGEPIFSASIECFSRGQLPITENLSAALFHLRLADRLRVLWVDAICINQQDLVERSHQVTLMRDTFEGAENVIVWLGEDTGDANEAFEMLRNMESSPPSEDIRYILYSHRKDALRRLLERSWFRRIWVVQELICASKATIKCGNHSMEWERFSNGAERIRLSKYYGIASIREVYDALHILHGIRWERRRRRRKQREEATFEGWLWKYRRCLASDPRDKVFALVGIAHRQIAAAYTPDYSKDALEVYRNLAIHLIIIERNPDFLANCAHIVGSQVPLLPSWVPDWSQPLNVYSSPISCPGAYEASAGTSFKGKVSEDLDELFLDGVILNKVEVLGGVWDGLRIDKVKSLKSKIELNEEYLGIFRQSPRYRGCYWSAFTRALVADKDHTGSRMGQRDLSEVYVAYRKCFSQDLIFQATGRFSFHEGFGETVEWQEVNELDWAINYAALGRTFCIFDDGRAGWAPVTAEVGDRISIFLGATVPILLRPRGNGYIVLGEAYVHEMMDGQAFEGPDVQIETITLI